MEQNGSTWTPGVGFADDPAPFWIIRVFFTIEPRKLTGVIT